MNELTSSEIKEICLNLLRYLDEICRNNDVNYSVAYGTLLGAVRHNGFIPWDDDVDIIMSRDNYNKFASVLEKQINPQYKLFECLTVKKFSAPLAKLVDLSTELTQYTHAEKIKLGIYIDIFVFDKVPNQDTRKKVFRNQDTLQLLWTMSEMKPISGEKNIIKKAIKRIANLGMARVFALAMTRNAIKCAKNNESSNEYGNLLYCVYGRNKEIFEESFFEKYIDLPFETIIVKGFQNYDSMLKTWYGDYMQLPPVEKRVSHHDFYVKWSN